jgi:hypothetical protein
MALPFPSTAFFEALQGSMRAEHERFARLGFFDTTFVGTPEFLEPLVLLAAGSRDRAALERGAAFARRWLATSLDEYLERCVVAGLGERRERSRLPRLVAQVA